MDEAKKRKVFLLAICGLVALLVIVTLVVLLWEEDRQPAATESHGSSSVVVPEGELLVSDIYNGQSLIPDFDFPLNQYDTKKFIDKEGIVTYDDPQARLGVDVSAYQGDVDWAAVKADGYDFAFIRLGYRGSTQGLLNVDSKFEQNLQGATDAGLFVGVYFFSQAVTEAEARAEADFVLEVLNGRKLAYPVVFDWERPLPSEELPAEDLRAYDLSGDQATACAKAFCKRIEEAGYTPCMYTNKYMAYNFFNLGELKEYDLWYAEYQKAPSLYYDFRIWQYTESGKVSGIEGGVDINICFRPY